MLGYGNEETSYKLKKSIQKKLLEYFVLEVTARSVTDILGIHVVYTDYLRSYAVLDIMLEKMANSGPQFLLKDVIYCCFYLIECIYSDNDVEYGSNANHFFRLPATKTASARNLPEWLTLRAMVKLSGLPAL